MSFSTVFKISGAWLLVSSSSLMATGIDKIFSVGWLEDYSKPIFSIDAPSWVTTLETLLGIRFQPSLIHLITFVAFWAFVSYKDPLKMKKK